MKNVKKAFLTIIGGIAVMGSTFAMHPPHHLRSDSSNRNPEEMADLLTVKMKYALNLDAEQEAKVKAINQKYAKQQKQYIDSSRKVMDELATGMNKISKGKDKELASILKSDQMTKYNSNKNEMRDHHHGGRGHHGKGHHGKDHGRGHHRSWWNLFGHRK